MKPTFLFIYIILFSLLSCGNRKNDKADSSSGENKKGISSDIFEKSKRLCVQSAGEWNFSLSMCVCKTGKFFNLKNDIGCDEYKEERSSEKELELILLKALNSRYEGGGLFWNEWSIKQSVSDVIIPTILLPFGNEYVRIQVDSKNISNALSMHNVMYKNILNKYLKERIYLEYYDSINNQINYNILFYHDYDHFLAVNNLSPVNFIDSRTNQIVGILKQKPVSTTQVFVSKNNCDEFCSISKSFGIQNFQGSKYLVKLERDYELGQLITNQLNFYSKDTNMAEYVVSLDFANNPNLIFKMEHTFSMQNLAINTTDRVLVLNPFTWDVLYTEESNDSYQRPNQETKHNSVVACDGGIHESFMETDAWRINYGPGEKSILGWEDKTKSYRDQTYGIKPLGRNNIIEYVSHLDIMMKNHNLDNIIPLDFKYCFSHFSNVKEQLQKYSNKIINLSAVDVYDTEECEKTPYYKTIKENNDFLWVLSSGNDGLDIDKSSSKTCPQNTDLKNTLVVGSTKHFSNFGKKNVDIIYPYSGSTSEATLLTSNLARNILEINRDLSVADIKRILILSADLRDDLKSKVKSGGVINPEKALELASTYKTNNTAEELVYGIREAEFTSHFWRFNRKQVTKDKILKKYKDLFTNYGEIK